MLELLSLPIILAQSVGPGYVGRPTVYAPYYICLNDPRSYVNLRSGPSTQARKLGKLYQGNTVDILSRGEGQHDGMWWAYVRTPNGGTGFVRDDYVCVR
jgi:hypothetical protein